MFVRFHPPAKSRGLPADKVKTNFVYIGHVIIMAFIALFIVLFGHTTPTENTGLCADLCARSALNALV